MKLTIREVMNKLRDIEEAIKIVHEKLPDEKGAYIDDKDLVIDLLEEYAESIKNTKVDI